MHLQGHQIGHFANEAGQALSVPIGSPDEATGFRSELAISLWWRNSTLKRIFLPIVMQIYFLLRILLPNVM